jgi:hypothetical protein
MAGRRTNLALAALLPVAFVTGWMSFAAGSEHGRWVAVAHGIAGLTIVVIAPWKSVIAGRGVRRRDTGRAPSLALTALVAASLGFGLAHSAGLRTLGPVTSMQLHVGASLVAVPFAVYHFFARRIRVHRTDFRRRQVLRAAGLLGGGAAAYAGVEAVTRTLSLSGADRRFTGSHETGSFDPDAMPVTQWLNDPIPHVNVDAWRLVVRTGAGERAWTYDEIDAYADEVRATIDCTGGWFAVQEWSGARLARLVGDIEERSILVRSVTGYDRLLPARDVPSLVVATRASGAPLSPGHGFPARLVAPGRRGFWWVKWISVIEATDRPWWVQPPFPLT